MFSNIITTPTPSQFVPLHGHSLPHAPPAFTRVVSRFVTPPLIADPMSRSSHLPCFYLYFHVYVSRSSPVATRCWICLCKCLGCSGSPRLLAVTEFPYILSIDTLGFAKQKVHRSPVGPPQTLNGRRTPEQKHGDDEGSRARGPSKSTFIREVRGPLRTRSCWDGDDWMAPMFPPPLTKEEILQGSDASMTIFRVQPPATRGC